MSILLIFIKNPRPGKVKTRLARTLGDAEALRIYHILLEKTRQSALGVAARRWLFYSDFVENDDAWPNRDFEKKAQHGDDLGQRMENAFRSAFEAGAQKAVIIGSDCPELSPDILEAAFATLDRADFVLGPTTDGGYYLLGMNRFSPAVFRGVAWSTEQVLSQTLANVEKMDAKAMLLPRLSDIDTEADWRFFSGER